MIDSLHEEFNDTKAIQQPPVTESSHSHIAYNSDSQTAMAPKPSKKGALAKPSKAATKPSSPATHSTPNWPLFRPLLPPSDLSLQTLVPSQIVLIHNFWTSTLCKDYVNFLKGLPLATTPGVPKRGDAVRVNDRFQIQDAVFANRLWEETGLRELVCGGGEGEEEGEDGMTREQRGALW
jgi:hypothetical protein